MYPYDINDVKKSRLSFPPLPKDEDSNRTHDIEIHCQAMKSTMGLFDHYFIVIDNMEYHMGLYQKGALIPLGSTKGSHLITIRTICDQCYRRIVMKYNAQEDRRMALKYYPIINCETLVMGMSVQVVLITLVLPFLILLICKGLIIYSILLFVLTLTLQLWYSKSLYCSSTKTLCVHLKRIKKTKNK